MIAKRVQKKSASDFKLLAGYVLAEQNGGRGDPLDWKLGAYVLDQSGGGEKVAWAHSTNCANEIDLGWAVKEIQSVQALNQTARSDKSYHLVVSFPTGERPSREQMEDIERELCASIGFADHQRIAAVHQNTDHWHMHIAINRVHPMTLRAVEPFRDRYKLQEACAALEIKHDLQISRHTTSAEQRIESRAGHSDRGNFARWVMDHAAEPIKTGVAAAKTWTEVHAAMADYGVELKPRGAGLVIANQGDARSAMKASAVARNLSFKALTDRFGPFEAAPPLIGKMPKMRYVGQPHGAAPGLWEEYQKERRHALLARKAAMTALHAGHLKHGQDMNNWYRKRHAAAKAARLNRGDRISTRAVLDNEFRADHAKRRKRDAQERKALMSEHKIPTWESFLAQQASRGDQHALKTLEHRVDAHMISVAESVGRGGRS